MINEKMHALGDEPSAIRELFAYGMARAAEVGAENVFDFSIGNPSVPAPPKVRETILALMEEDPVSLHGYTPASGDPAVREVVARHIRERYGVEATPGQLYLTAGAAAAIAISLSAVTHPGDEVIVIAPYFPEYRVWIETSGATCVEVPADPVTFDLDVDAVAAALTARTKAVVVNSPNNPVGVVYGTETLTRLAVALEEAERTFDTSIYLVSDEPYREIVYGAEVPWVPGVYGRTVVCYSYSKSLSLPGERIGWVLVPDTNPDHDELVDAVAGAARALGFVCAPSLFQRVIVDCVDVPADVAAYAENRALLCEGLKALGYEYVEPQGAFYLWVKALEPDAQAFFERAREFELLPVPSDSFGCGGWVRVGYCVSRDTIERSMAAWEALAKSYR